jgi:PKD repeat protein/glucose/arabinose dehydrogenase
MGSNDEPKTTEQLKNKLQTERRQFLRAIGAAGLVGLAANPAGAQTNKSEAVDPDNYAHSPALPPSKALETFKLAPGYEIELVASEPLTINPVEIKWDAKGRMWVVEMPDYMTTLEGDSSGPESPNARIKVLEDTNGDGKMDKSTVFLDDLSLARAIGFVNEGKLVADETELTFHADTTDDLTPDTREVLIEDFVNPDNPEHTDNGLRFMMDNWLYNAKSDLRMRFRDGDLAEDKTHFRGQWGITQDNYGRLYYNVNYNWLYADLVPGDYLLRGSFESSHGIGAEIVDNSSIYTVQKNYGTNRAYRDGYHRPDGRMREITAACGPGIYRGDLFDEEIVNQAFIPDPAGHVVGQFDIQEDGLNLETEHLTYDDEKWGQREFLASTDEVFRPTYAKTGPDGALYIVDMYHGIFQHETYLTDYLRNYILEHNLHKVPPAGRIYRIVPEDGKPNKQGPPDHAGKQGPPDHANNDDIPALDELEPTKLATSLMDANGWVRDTAQRLIVQQSMTEASPILREIARASYESDEKNGGPPDHAGGPGGAGPPDHAGPPDDTNNEEVGPVARMHALWALHGLDRIDMESVFSAMASDHTHLSMAAMRTGEALLNTDHNAKYVNRLVEFTNADHLRLVVQAAYSLGEVSNSELQSQAEDVLNQLLTEYEDNQFITDAVNSSLESLGDGGGNESPTASFTTSPSSVSPGDSVTFDASDSADPDGSISSYEWDFGDGSTATGQTVSHTYDSTGDYTVTLTVTDDGGATATATTTITVGDGDGTGAIAPGTTITFDGYTGGWEATAPSAISGQTNPTLTLQEGAQYTLQFTNQDGAPHDITVQDSGGNILKDSGDYVNQIGATDSIDITASTDMATYVCTAHPTTMVGNIEVV